jgi:glycosyltransferase involved in cell wall biosynthesis
MKLSIVIPTLNEESIIRRTLDSLKRGLTIVPFEIIVMDDGSTDRTVAIAREYARVITIDPKNKDTIAWTKNHGAAQAQGEYLLFLDADVILPNPDDIIRRALAKFAADPQLVGLTAKLRVYPEDETWGDWLCFGMVNWSHWLNNNVLKVGSASGEFQLVRTDVFRAIGGYDAKLAVAEDNEFFRRLRKRGHTRIAMDITVLHSGRRAHRIGWPRLLLEWGLNWFSVIFRKRSFHKEWRVIR